MENFVVEAFDSLQCELESLHVSDLEFGKSVAKFKGYSITYNVFLSYSANDVCMLGFGSSFVHCRMFCGSNLDSAMRAARFYYDVETMF